MTPTAVATVTGELPILEYEDDALTCVHVCQDHVTEWLAMIAIMIAHHSPDESSAHKL